MGIFKPGLPVLRRIGRLVLGSAEKGKQAFPKLLGIVLPLAAGWLDNKLGWNLMQFLGEDGGDAFYLAVAGYMGWRLPMMRPAP